MTEPRIFVKIAAYRDSELLKTISSLLAAADRPLLVDFGIVNQVGEETRGQLDLFRDDPRFTVFELDWSQSIGLGWARHMCDQMWRGQAFTLQIDSHMRFLRGWDTAFISDWEKTGDEKAVISCYPAVYGFRSDWSEFFQSTLPHQIKVHSFFGDGVPELRSGADVAPLTRGLFVAGGLQFSAGSVCENVPNLETVFYGDETAHSVRLYTHGYSVYAPTKVTSYHLYERHKWMKVNYWTADVSGDRVLTARYDRFRSANMETIREILDPLNSRFLGNSRTKASFWETAETEGLLQ